MIQIGIVGSGFIGPAHIEALRRLGFVEVVALGDVSLAAAQDKARQLNIPHAYADVDALLAHPGAAGGAQLHAELPSCAGEPADPACRETCLF